MPSNIPAEPQKRRRGRPRKLAGERREFLQKPFDIRELPDVMHRYLARTDR